MDSLTKLQQEIIYRLMSREAASLDDVEAALDARPDLSEEEKAALWLYGRSFVPNPIARTEAVKFVRALKARGGTRGLKAKGG